MDPGLAPFIGERYNNTRTRLFTVRMGEKRRKKKKKEGFADLRTNSKFDSSPVNISLESRFLSSDQYSISSRVEESLKQRKMPGWGSRDFPKVYGT